MPAQATYDDANLILHLYEVRREEKMRKAREWLMANFAPSSLEDAMKVAGPGTPENAMLRQVASYWEMAASFVTAGVLNQELFFQNNGEMLIVWERVRPIVPALRDWTKNPNSWRNLETVGNAYIKWMEANGPEAYPAFQAMAKTLSSSRASE